MTDGQRPTATQHLSKACLPHRMADRVSNNEIKSFANLAGGPTIRSKIVPDVKFKLASELINDEAASAS
jgi:hypothetical protein